jgi:PAS domain S-box-containing protein
MKKKISHSRQNNALRVQAEKLLSEQGRTAEKPSQGDAVKLVHELQVHQIELEMQNEELRRAHQEIEASRNKYVDLFNDLYDFSPVGYFTLDEKGTILEANLAGAVLLGAERGKLLKQPFTLFVAPDSQDLFQQYQRRVLSTTDRKSCEIKLKTKDSKEFYADIESITLGHKGTAGSYRMAVIDISERKQTEKELREARDFTEHVFKTVPDGIMLTDCRGYITRVNKAVEGLLGFTEEELKGKHPAELSPVNGESVKIGGDMMIGLRKQGFLKNFEAEWLRKDETVISVELNITFLKDSAGVVTGSVAVIRDISERRKSEKIIKKSEERLRLALYASSEGMWDWNLETGKVYFSPHYYEMLGYADKELPSSYETFKNLLHPEDLPAVNRTVEDVMQNRQESFVVEMRMKAKSGQWIWIQSRGRAIERDPSGALVRMVGTHTDITERRKVQDALRKSEERFRALIEQANDAIYITDSRGVMKIWNQKSAELYGYTADEVLGKQYTMLLPVRFRDIHGKWLQRFIAEEITTKPTFDEGINTCKDGTELRVESSVAPLYQDEEKYYIVISRDISERKQAEEALRESEALKNTILDSLSAHIVVLDAQGIIVATNEQWRKFARENGLMDMQKAAEGISYLSVCHAAVRAGVDDAAEHLQGIEDVLNGKRPGFTAEYPCHSPTEKRWFTMRVTRRGCQSGGVVIAHQNITEQKLSEIAIENSLIHVRALAARLETVREVERTRIARMVHDELGQALAGLKLDIASIEIKLSAKDSKLQTPLILKKIKAINTLITDTVPIVNRIVSQLRPPVLDDLGLEAAIEWQVKSYQERTGIRCSISSNLKDLKLEREQATRMFRILQETLRNVLRHAKATAVKILLRHKKNSLVMKVRDNGRGITEKEINDFCSFGLTGMRERAILLDGELQISGRPGKGTTVSVSIPIKKTTASRNSAKQKEKNVVLRKSVMQKQKMVVSRRGAKKQ